MKFASRKFIDLIQGATSKWANWDPPTPIAVGDYGTIDRETGEFIPDGNIYHQDDCKSFDFDINDQALKPQVQEHGDDRLIVNSWGVTTRTVNVSAEVNIGPANGALTIELEFNNNKRAAVLLIHKPRYTILPNNERRIASLLKDRPDALRGKYVVTQVISCTSYMMYLSDAKKEKFSVTLSADVPLLPTVDAGGAGFKVLSESYSGIFRTGSHSEAKFIPLYRLQKPRMKFLEWLGRGRRSDEVNDDEKWDDVEPSWDPLDENGEEDEVYDAEMDGDFGVFNGGYPDNDDDDDY